jgi:hypothetical protein
MSELKDNKLEATQQAAANDAISTKQPGPSSSMSDKNTQRNKESSDVKADKVEKQPTSMFEKITQKSKAPEESKSSKLDIGTNTNPEKTTHIDKTTESTKANKIEKQPTNMYDKITQRNKESGDTNADKLNHRSSTSSDKRAYTSKDSEETKGGKLQNQTPSMYDKIIKRDNVQDHVKDDKPNHRTSPGQDRQDQPSKVTGDARGDKTDKRSSSMYDEVIQRNKIYEGTRGDKEGDQSLTTLNKPIQTDKPRELKDTVPSELKDGKQHELKEIISEELKNTKLAELNDSKLPESKDPNLSEQDNHPKLRNQDDIKLPELKDTELTERKEVKTTDQDNSKPSELNKPKQSEVGESRLPEEKDSKVPQPKDNQQQVVEQAVLNDSGPRNGEVLSNVEITKPLDQLASDSGDPPEPPERFPRSTPAEREEFKKYIGDKLGDSKYEEYVNQLTPIIAEHPELNDIPLEDLVAIRAFTDKENKLYKEVNEALRNEDKDPGKMAELRPLSNCIISGLGQLPAYEGIVHRDIDLKDEGFKGGYEEGKLTHWEAFSSTSIKPGEFAKVSANADEFAEEGGTYNPNYYNTMISINSKYGRDVSFLSVHPEEKEILFPPTTITTLDIYKDPNEDPKTWAGYQIHADERLYRGNRKD